MSSTIHFEDKFIRIDIENEKYKILKRLLGIPFSDGWKKLPDLHHIAITLVKMQQTLHSASTIGNSSTMATEKIAVYVMGKQKGQRIEAGKFDSLKDAENLATKLSDYLNLSVKNYMN